MARQPKIEKPEEDSFDEHDVARKINKKEKEETQKEKNEIPIVKHDRQFYIVLIAILGVIALLIFGYNFVFGKTTIKSIDELHSENLAGVLDSDEGYLYNGFSFVKVNDQWWTRFERTANGQTYNVQLRYSPNDLKEIPITGDYIYFLRFNASFVTFDPLGKNLSYVALAASDISQSMVKVFDIAAFPACTQQDNSTC